MYGTQDTNRVEEIYTFLVGYPLTVPEDPEIIARRGKLSALPISTYGTILRQLYGTRNIEEILQMEPNILEPYIFAMRGLKPAQLPALFAMMGMVFELGIILETMRSTICIDMNQFFVAQLKWITDRDLQQFLRLPFPDFQIRLNSTQIKNFLLAWGFYSICESR